MAEEVHGSIQGPNGERLQLQLGSKSIGISAKDLVPILLLIILGTGGYMLWSAVDRRLSELVQGQVQLQIIATANKEAVIEALHTQQTFITEVVHQGQKRQESQAEVMQRLLMILELPPGILGGEKPLKSPDN